MNSRGYTRGLNANNSYLQIGENPVDNPKTRVYNSSLIVYSAYSSYSSYSVYSEYTVYTVYKGLHSAYTVERIAYTS